MQHDDGSQKVVDIADLIGARAAAVKFSRLERIAADAEAALLADPRPAIQAMADEIVRLKAGLDEIRATLSPRVHFSPLSTPPQFRNPGTDALEQIERIRLIFDRLKL